jgi:hypothetical protein
MVQSAAIRTAPRRPGRRVGALRRRVPGRHHGGSLAGGLLYEKAGLAIMIRASAALVMVAPMSVTAIRGVFEIPQATSRK